MNEVTVGDNRLAKNQKYQVRVEYMLDHLTWSKEEEDFEVYKTTGWYFLGPFRFSDTSSSRKMVKILEENTEINELEEKGSSQLYWKGRAVDRWWPAKDYIIWEREHHDELNGK